MATADVGFVAGLRAGGGLVSQALENDRLDAAADRQAEEFKWKKTDQERLRKQQGEEDTAWDNYKAAGVGLSPEMVGKVKDTYGMTPAQIAAAGPALKAKLAGYDVPDSSDLQNVPAAAPAAPAAGAAPADGGGPAPALGLQPPGRFTADQVVQGAPDRLAQERALAGVAAAKRDVKGIRESDEAQQKLKQDQIFNTVGKMTDDEIVARAKTLNTNDSNVPILYTGKGKGGYDFMTTDPDGSPGKKFSLNMAQMRQLVVAQEMGKADFGREALAMASSTHKDIGESIGKWNEATAKMQQGNTTALHYANADANDAARTGIMREELGLKKDKAKQENKEVWGATGEGILNYNKATGGLSFEPFPKDMPDNIRDLAVKKYRTQYEPKYSTDGQMMTLGPDSYDRNPNYNKKSSDKLVNTTDQWIRTTPGKTGDGATALKAYIAGQAGGGSDVGPPKSAAGPAPAAPAAAPKGGLDTPSWFTATASANRQPGVPNEYMAQRKAERQAEQDSKVRLQQTPSADLRAIIKQGYGPGASNSPQVGTAIDELKRRGELQ